MPVDGSVTWCVARIRPNYFRGWAAFIEKAAAGENRCDEEEAHAWRPARRREKKMERAGQEMKMMGGENETRASADWICPRARAVELRSPIPEIGRAHV